MLHCHVLVQRQTPMDNIACRCVVAFRRAQDAVCDLAVAPDNAPAAMVGLLLALRRVHVLLAMGASELATHEAVESACQVSACVWSD